MAVALFAVAQAIELLSGPERDREPSGPRRLKAKACLACASGSSPEAA